VSGTRSPVHFPLGFNESQNPSNDQRHEPTNTPYAPNCIGDPVPPRGARDGRGGPQEGRPAARPPRRHHRIVIPPSTLCSDLRDRSPFRFLAAFALPPPPQTCQTRHIKCFLLQPSPLTNLFLHIPSYYFQTVHTHSYCCAQASLGSQVLVRPRSMVAKDGCPVSVSLQR